MAVWRWAVANRFRRQGLELKLGWSASTAARPHAWPLALSGGSLLLAAFATRVVDRGTKDAGKCHTRATARITS